MRGRASALCGAALALVALLLWTRPPLAEGVSTDDYIVRSGDWAGGGFTDASGHFSTCFVIGPTTAGDDVSFTLFHDGTLLLALDADLWPGERDSGLEFRVIVEGASQRTFSERIEDLLAFEIARDREFYAALKEASGVTLVAEAKLLHLPFDGHARIALAGLEDCLQHFTGIDLTAAPKPATADSFSSPPTDGAATEARETGYQIDVGPWTGAGYADHNGFSSCGIARKIDSVAIVIGLTRDRTLTILLAANAWKRSIVGGQHNLVMRVDSTAERWVSATGIDGNLIAKLGPDAGFLEALKRGNRLVIEGAPQEISFKLKPDAKEALSALEHCYMQHTGLDLVGNPVSGNMQPPTIAADESKASAAAPPAAPTTKAASPPPLSPSTPTETSGNGADALADLILNAISSAGYPSPELRTNDGGYSWSSTKTGIIGTFLVNDPSNFSEAYIEKMELLGQGCGPTLRLSFDTVLTTRTGREVYGATLQCPGESYEIHQATLVDASVALLFFHVSSDAEASFAARINKNLRTYLVNNW